MSGTPTGRLLLLGSPAFVPDKGAALALTPERRGQLLALLALRRGSDSGWVVRAELSALLWPELAAKLAHNNLRKTLFRLQDVAWGALVQAEGSALRFTGSCDVHDFEAAVAAGRPAEALALRRGTPLAGFDDAANEPYTHWLNFERERLDTIWRRVALDWLAAQRQEDAAASDAAALDLVAQLREHDPLDEAALAEQVRWLLRGGQLAAARRACALFAERLRDELGLSPPATLRSLQASLDDSAPRAAPVRSAPSAPVADEDFVGRGSELRRIASLLGDGSCRWLALRGPGGIGKTRLARRAMQELASRFADGALFVSLEDADDSAAALGERLAHALASAARRHADALDDAIESLRDRERLLVLDNAESIASQGAALQRLLSQCPRLTLLLTSRVRLSLPANDGLAAQATELTLDGLPWPDAEDLDRLEAFDAVRLFVRAARRVTPDFSASGEASAIAEICARVEGLPLALELAAAWVRMLPCEAIAAELRAGSELLRAQDASRSSRHASLEQVFMQSWQRLGGAERDALARLALCRGGFDAPAARAVAEASLATLAALVDKSLLHRDGARLKLHPLVQQLAVARLTDTQRRGALQAHAGYYLRLLARVRADVESGQREALRLLDAEADNARLAWQSAALDDTPAAALAHLMSQAALALMAHADLRGWRQDGVELGLRAADSPAARGCAPLQAVLLASCAHLQHRLGREEDAVALASRAFALAGREHLDAATLALRVLVGSFLHLGRLDEARQRAAEGLALARDAGDSRSAAVLLGNLALVEKHGGHYDEALRLSLQALQVHRTMSSPADLARVLNNLADLQLILTDLDGAEVHLREAAVLCERFGIVGTHGLVLANLSYLCEQRGHLDEAAQHGRQAAELLGRLGDRSNSAALRQQLAQLALRRGDAPAARHELAAAMSEAVQTRYAALVLHGLVVLADVLLADGDSGSAAQVLAFVAAHPALIEPMRAELAQRRERLPAGLVAAPWPAGVDMDEVAQRIVAEAGIGYAGLKSRLRGPAGAAPQVRH